MIQQPSLLDPGVGGSAEAPQRVGVAQVLVLTALAHLDHTFDYAIPASMDAQVRAGVRVKVRFAGTERDGFVLARSRGTDHRGSLAELRRVVSDLPVLTEQMLAVCRAVAHRYAGTSTDVVRLAIPPRHAGAEKAALASWTGERGQRAGPDWGADPGLLAELAQSEVPADLGHHWADYAGGAAFLRRLALGESPRAVWCALPGKDGAEDSEHPHWAVAITAAVQATRASGRSAVVVLPDVRDVQRLSAAMGAGGLDHEILTADQGTSARYRRYVLALTGQAPVIIGTRSAAFAPVRDLGMVVCWDDGDDVLVEQRAPYPHARQVLVERAEVAGAAALIGGFTRTPAAQMLLRDGWARSVQADRATVRSRAPRVQAPGEVDLAREGAAARARIPTPAHRMARAALARGPVLVQVPRAGYLPSVACAQCREPARCSACHGPLRLAAARATPSCAWCGKVATTWRCSTCEHTRVRAVRVGSGRTAEELGRAFPGVPVVVSDREGGVLDDVDDRPRLVVSTPGAEPAAAGGYRAALLLDAAVLTERPELDAGIEAVRRWMQAAALVRSAPDGGVVMLLGHGAPIPAQALVRWDPVGLAERELAERTELDFPPVTRMVSVLGDRTAVTGFLRVLQSPPQTTVLGPVEHLVPGRDLPTAAPGGLQEHSMGDEPIARALVRVPRELGPELATALIHAQAHRSARKEPGTLRVRVDPDRLF